MAGLLSDVLPFLYQQGDRAKRYVGGLLSDPVGTMQQTAGLLADQDRAQQGLLNQAFADQSRPFRVTDRQAMGQAADNMLAGPLGMAPAGITAWHGSPHVFDKFDSSKIGTGEGAQAYGHGLYLAESPGVANEYKRALGGDALIAGDKTVVPKPGTVADVALAHLASAPSDANPYRWAAKSVNISREGHPDQGFYDRVEKALAVMETKGVKAGEGGSLYKVDLPDPVVAKMLDWDRKLSEQAPEVRAAIDKMGLGSATTGADAYKRVADFDSRANVAKVTMSGGRDPESALRMTFPGITDAEVKAAIAKAKSPSADAIAASVLRDAGIPGIRYLDGGSRGAGQGSSNFVVFPGEENMLRILERNGQPLR